MISSTIVSPLLFSSLLFDLSHAATFDIINQCSYTIWPAAVPGGGRELNPGETWNLTINPQTIGHIWARTACSFDNNGHGSCQTGDCNGLLECQEGYGAPPDTLVEFALNQFQNLDFFDVSLVDGFNVPVEFRPAGNCSSRGAQCTADITGKCPEELKVPGGCNSPCNMFKTNEYCCYSGSCAPTNYSRFFKNNCPSAYIYPTDDETTGLTCPGGTNYRVVFCP